MHTPYSRRYSADTARGKIFVPIVLLLLGVSLSCSTACITASVVGSVSDNARAVVADAKQQRKLSQNILNRSRGRARDPLTNDPASIQRTLALALPMSRYARSPNEPDRVEITVSDGPDQRRVYVITALGDFDGLYDHAFVDYVNRVRQQLRPAPIFRLTLVSTTDNFKFTGMVMELK